MSWTSKKASASASRCRATRCGSPDATTAGKCPIAQISSPSQGWVSGRRSVPTVDAEVGGVAEQRRRARVGVPDVEERIVDGAPVVDGPAADEPVPRRVHPHGRDESRGSAAHQQVRRLLDGGRPLQPVVVARGQHLRHHAHPGRRPSSAGSGTRARPPRRPPPRAGGPARRPASPPGPAPPPRPGPRRAARRSWRTRRARGCAAARSRRRPAAPRGPAHGRPAPRTRRRARGRRAGRESRPILRILPGAPPRRRSTGHVGPGASQTPLRRRS